MPEDIAWDRVDNAATLHEGDRVWKQLDWGITDRLYESGYISGPKSKARSVVLTPEGRERAERLFGELFTR
jgi:hypothetical protein